jgi:large subunit ribosomal protein L15
MQINNLKRKTANRKRMIVARGGTRGKTAGRGTKGQKARAGHKIRPEIRDVIKRIPKMRGRGKNSNLSIQPKSFAVNLNAISAAFSNGDTISRRILIEKGIVSARYSESIIKILGSGELTKKVTFKGVTVSGSAKQKIEKSGSTIYG